ncbi:hypothetical protein [Burkholderia cenocepacia]|uniref:hypothetical protein n=1 Tax=Burkholderia cepacia complex TaxID=87882 RepID=UPI00201266CF|nr:MULTISPECIES: hypothetical protein [Burkholderia cepacia complex]MDN7562687.1 hypothetical protein [Burkholderia orbicola]
MAEYLTVLPPRETLQAKLHQSIAAARARLDDKRGGVMTNASLPNIERVESPETPDVLVSTLSVGERVGRYIEAHVFEPSGV